MEGSNVLLGMMGWISDVTKNFHSKIVKSIKISTPKLLNLYLVNYLISIYSIYHRVTESGLILFSILHKFVRRGRQKNKTPICYYLFIFLYPFQILDLKKERNFIMALRAVLLLAITLNCVLSSEGKPTNITTTVPPPDGNMFSFIFVKKILIYP